MIENSQLLNGVPEILRKSLLDEYRLISQSYFERRWLESELYAGRFCEIVYCILLGHATQSYPDEIKKPKDFVGACRSLESNSNEPRSFQILIPRMLPALYEVRNNRNVGHVGGDVSSNAMDANFVFSAASWVVAEFIRHFHKISVLDAQEIVDRITERKISIIWSRDNIKRILDPKLPKKYQVLILLQSEVSMEAEVSTLQEWIEYKNRSDFLKMLRTLHKDKLVELTGNGRVILLPTGSRLASDKIRTLTSI